MIQFFVGLLVFALVVASLVYEIKVTRDKSNKRKSRIAELEAELRKYAGKREALGVKCGQYEIAVGRCEAFAAKIIEAVNETRKPNSQDSSEQGDVQ